MSAEVPTAFTSLLATREDRLAAARERQARERHAYLLTCVLDQLANPDPRDTIRPVHVLHGPLTGFLHSWGLSPNVLAELEAAGEDLALDEAGSVERASRAVRAAIAELDP